MSKRDHHLQWIFNSIFNRKSMKSSTASFVMHHRLWVLVPVCLHMLHGLYVVQELLTPYKYVFPVWIYISVCVCVCDHTSVKIIIGSDSLEGFFRTKPMPETMGT